MRYLVCATMVMLVLIACGGDDGPSDAPTPAGDGITAIHGAGRVEFNCDWLIEQWNAALKQAGGQNMIVYEDYKPALLIVAKAMEPLGDPPYIYGDADRVLRQCSGLQGYPPWKN